MPQSIEFRHDRRRLVIPIEILAPWPTTLAAAHGTALIDTGSTTSGIKRWIAAELRLSQMGKRPMGTISGDAQIERFTFRIGLNATRQDDAPGFPFVFEEVLGFELRDGFAFDALIGMDILAQCGLSLRPDGQCTLAFG